MAGQLTGVVTLDAVQDALVETDETIIVNITGVTKGTESGSQQVTATIIDDDILLPRPSVTLNVTPATLVDEPQPTAPVVVASPQTTRVLRILVVDDNADTVLSFSMLLRALGDEVRTAHDGPEGVAAAIEFLPDAAMLEIGLTGLNGFEVAKRIRQEPALKDITLIALTGYGQETDRQASKDAGFDHQLVKPADFGKLQQILETVSK